MRGCNKRYRRCDMARGSLRPQKSHPSSHHELHGSLFRLLPSSRLNRCDSGYVAAAHLHKRTRDLHPSKVLSRPSVECSLAGAHSSSSQCEPAQAWEVDMCASKHHFARCWHVHATPRCLNFDAARGAYSRACFVTLLSATRRKIGV